MPTAWITASWFIPRLPLAHQRDIAQPQGGSDFLICWKTSRIGGCGGGGGRAALGWSILQNFALV